MSRGACRSGTMVAVTLAAGLLCAGCRGSSGSGLFGLFGGSESDTTALSSLFSDGSGDAGGDAGGALDGGGTLGGGLPDVRTVHNPEPGSIALFGAGLIGLGLWRRRKAAKRV